MIPLVRKEKDCLAEVEAKDEEIKGIKESIVKIKTNHIENIKTLNSSKVSSEQVKKIVIERDNVRYK
jgi:hypothetical protein